MYLRKLCNSPSLVYSNQHPLAAEINQLLNREHSTISDRRWNPKLVALRQILSEIGVGVLKSGQTDTQPQVQASQVKESMRPQNENDNNVLYDVNMVDSETKETSHDHKILIFSQMNSTLDIIAKDLESSDPPIQYLRIDGSVPVNKRFEIVEKFCKDPKIDILMMTTKIGGVGLSLQAADIVIFMGNN